jgi:hypothetical protein
MKPYRHARNSVRKWGGAPEDYLPIHDFIDSSKAHLADVRHRALLHSTFGIYLVEKVFGRWIINSADVRVQTRDVAEDHVLEDLGTIPPVADWLREMPIAQWMGGPVSRVKTTTLDQLKED